MAISPMVFASKLFSEEWDNNSCKNAHKYRKTARFKAGIDKIICKYSTILEY